MKRLRTRKEFEARISRGTITATLRPIGKMLYRPGEKLQIFVGDYEGHGRKVVKVRLTKTGTIQTFRHQPVIDGKPMPRDKADSWVLQFGFVNYNELYFWLCKTYEKDWSGQYLIWEKLP